MGFSNRHGGSRNLNGIGNSGYRSTRHKAGFRQYGLAFHGAVHNSGCMVAAFVDNGGHDAEHQEQGRQNGSRLGQRVTHNGLAATASSTEHTTGGRVGTLKQDQDDECGADKRVKGKKNANHKVVCTHLRINSQGGPVKTAHASAARLGARPCSGLRLVAGCGIIMYIRVRACRYVPSFITSNESPVPMMQAFRTFGSSKYSKAMLFLLVACFGAWGIGDYLMPSIGMQAAKVNGQDISPRLLEQTYNQRVQNVTQLMGTRPTQEQMDQMQLAEQVLAEVIARTVLQQSAAQLGFQPATKQLQAEITKIGAFKNEKGQFDVARYRQLLAQIGRTPQQFEADMGQDLTVRSLAQLSRVETPSPSLVAGIVAAENLKMGFEVATLTPASVGTLPAPKDEDLQNFYKQNEQVYSKPETRNLTVLRLSREDLVKTITVPEEEVKKAYEENKEHYKLPETRTVRHILFETKEAAEKAIPTITSKETFIAAANQLSQDPGNEGTKGGSLGTIKADDVVPAFRKEAFSIEANKLSSVVQSPFGFHLIWVDEIKPAHELPYAEIRDAIAKDLQTEQADEALVRLGGVVDEKIAAGQPLTEIATGIGMKALTFSTVRANDESLEPQELSTGFSLAQGETSQPLQMADGGAAYVQATKINPASVKPFAEVKADVTDQLRKAQTQQALRRMADTLLSAARAPGATTLEAAAQKAGINGVTTSNLSVASATEAPQWLQSNMLEFYPLATGTVLAGALPDGQNLHLVRLVSRETQPLDETKLPEQAKVYQQRLQGDVEALMLAYLTQKAKVQLNQPMLKQIFGREVQWTIAQ